MNRTVWNRIFVAIFVVLALAIWTMPHSGAADRWPIPRGKFAAEIPWEWLGAVTAYWEALDRAGEITPYTGPECRGRWAVPTSIVWRESHCSYTARNPSSSAGGAYQMLASVFATATRGAGNPQYAGMNAAYAPPWAQDAAAHWLVVHYGLAPWDL